MPLEASLTFLLQENILNHFRLPGTNQANCLPFSDPRLVVVSFGYGHFKFYRVVIGVDITKPIRAIVRSCTY